jgi:hypothetical protein
MKTLFTTAALVACFALTGVKAQTVNGIRLTEIKADVIELRAIQSTFADKIWIELQYGQRPYDSTDLYIKDDDGKKLAFNSAIDAVNKMKSYGYELFQVYSSQNGNDSSKANYVLKRK